MDVKDLEEEDEEGPEGEEYQLLASLPPLAIHGEVVSQGGVLGGRGGRCRGFG